MCGRVPRPSTDTSYAPAPTDRANATHGADTLRLSKVLLLLPLLTLLAWLLLLLVRVAVWGGRVVG